MNYNYLKQIGMTENEYLKVILNRFELFMRLKYYKKNSKNYILETLNSFFLLMWEFKITNSEWENTKKLLKDDENKKIYSFIIETLQRFNGK